MKRKVKKFAGGDRVKEYNREDEGLFGAKINYREDEDGRKYTAGKANPFDRNPQEQRYYSADDIKGKLSGLFGGKSKTKEEAAPAEDRPRAKSSFGYEDMDGRMPAESTWSGSSRPKAESKAAPTPEPAEAPKAKEAEGPFSRGANPNFESEREVRRGESAVADKDSGGGGSKASGTKAKKAKRPSNPDAPAYDTSGNERRSGDSQSFAPPPRSGMGPKNTFLTKERMKVDDTSGDSHLANEFKRRPRAAKDDEDYATKKKRERAGKDVRANSAVYGMKKGGMVKSASARADGCAIRGKTRA